MTHSCPEKFTLDVQRSDSGLYFVTSPHYPGLLVAERTLDEAFAAVSKAIADLAAVNKEFPV